MTATLSMVPVAQIRPSKANPRAEFDDERMAELIESVKRHGIITPLTLSRDGDGRYAIIAGERRYRATKAVKLREVPAQVREVEGEALTLAVAENVIRADLSPLEEARAYRRLVDEHGDAAKVAKLRRKPPDDVVVGTQADRLGDCGVDRLCLADGSERTKECPVAEAFGHVARGLQRKPRLPGPTGPCERDEAHISLHERTDRGQLSLRAEERPGGDRKADTPDRADGREVRRPTARRVPDRRDRKRRCAQRDGRRRRRSARSREEESPYGRPHAPEPDRTKALRSALRQRQARRAPSRTQRRTRRPAYRPQHPCSERTPGVCRAGELRGHRRTSLGRARSCVEPSTSVKRNVTVPLGSVWRTAD
jgi:ParB/RepB/Spo0J family partition protein